MLARKVEKQVLLRQAGLSQFKLGEMRENPYLYWPVRKLNPWQGTYLIVDTPLYFPRSVYYFLKTLLYPQARP
jgi:hypothetical protein